ncbi:MAG TPA: hypothetical protein V6D27_16940 [Vampirovibrionales bacterium]
MRLAQGAIALIVLIPQLPVQSSVSLKLAPGFRRVEGRSLLKPVHPPR